MPGLLATAELSFSTPANIVFGIVAAVMIYSAIRVVTSSNIVHAALHLIVVLGGIGVNYLLLQAEFVAVTQVLVYLGAIVVLFLFGIMLTRAPMGDVDDLDTPSMKPVGLLSAVLVLVVIGGSVLATFGDDKLAFVDGSPQTGVAQLSDSIFSTYLIPFEVVSVMLLAALIGSIVLARRD